MMRYFVVRSDHQAHEFMRLYFSQEDAWEVHREAIESLLGCDPDHNLAFSVTDLGLKTIPDHLKKSFRTKPENGLYWAKDNSAIKKKWIALASELQLPCLTQHKLFLFLGVHVLANRPKVLEMKVLGDRHYVIGNDHPLWKEMLWAEEITPRHYAEIVLQHEGGQRDGMVASSLVNS